ncbi:MAG TPA: 1-deoxy-D-xylulose-5-phosphate reductoisomerase, partial [Burkholderiales bacterium]|nr:1-deoxy-D-xylulose-5-phosphate reductoisomerase [Burkholderiales bacterium]
GPTIVALGEGIDLALANKESLVVGGELVSALSQATGARIIPVDSEHAALAQLIGPERANGPGTIERLTITASGGPFRGRTRAELETVTPDQALAHPTWTMGAKITIDSATLMNKGLEVIEAHHLFHVAPEQIEVVIHPQSIVHSLVEYIDGSVVAQLGNPDMRTPIAHALAFPERIESDVRPLDLFEVATLQFERPDMARFYCLRLAYEALRAGGAMPVYLNAANEIAVESFLAGRLPFDRIPVLIEEVLARLPAAGTDSLERILGADERARSAARDWLAAMVG